MPKHQQSVVRNENRIRFLQSVNNFAHRQFMRCLHECRARSYGDIVLDFSRCDRAFPNGMIPLLAGADALRRANIDLSVTLPANATLRRLFLNTNWAHFLEPTRYSASDTEHDRHVAAHRFADANQQQRLVNKFMDVVMRNMTLERSVLAGLEWSVNEITDNVLNHAQCDDGGIAQVSTFRDARKVAFGVADSGRGILVSLREGHSSLRTDEQAIGEAVKAGVTRNPESGQGNGIAGTLRIATMSNGTFEITSGVAHLSVRQGESKSYKREERLRFYGTVVYAELGLDTEFALSEALGFPGPHRPEHPVDIIEVLYETDDGQAVVLKLREESTGFGSRPAGRQLRTKCINLLNAEPTKPLLLDWGGVPLVSSSFADELIGKLFVTLGPLAFSARVRNVGMEAVVQGLIEKAIMQRVAQITSGPMVDGRTS